jgi:hypothetical protein
VKLIQNSISGKIHIRSKYCIVEPLCNKVIPIDINSEFEGDISKVTCKRCLKAYKESEKE